eukprot:tig00000808_g4395.t1
MNWGSQKVDVVSQNFIWREHIKKEMKLTKLNPHFRVNPHSMHTVTDKPAIVQRENPVPHTPTEIDAIMMRTIERSMKVPKEKYSVPQTTAQTVGWDHVPLVPPSCPERFRRPKDSCYETAYAAEYVKSMGKNPFSSTSR